MGESTLHGGLGKPPGLAMKGLQDDRRSERQPGQKRSADVQVIDQSEQVVDQVVVRDPPSLAPSSGCSPG